MVLHLAEQLDVPLRDRNALLLAGGYAPVFGQRGLQEPEMEGVRATLDLVLRGHEPYPAVVVDRHWGMVAGNRCAFRRFSTRCARSARMRCRSSRCCR